MARKKIAWRDRIAIGPGVLVIAGVVLVVAIVLVLRYVVTAPPHRLVIATGGPNGYFTKTAERYARRFAKQGVTLEIVSTTGAMDNLARIDAPGSNIDVAFVNGGLTDAARSPHLESLGSIAYDPLWVIYRTSLGTLDGIPKLKGLKIGIGGAGSGTGPIARLVLGASGIDASTTTLLPTIGDRHRASETRSRSPHHRIHHHARGARRRASGAHLLTDEHRRQRASATEPPPQRERVPLRQGH
ncbi:MAG: hypothetical protein ACRELY_15195 [Polyangiaceae bacterium]